MSAHKITAHNKLPTVRKLMLLHGVNNAMAVKYPVLLNDFRPDPELVLLSKRTVENLMKYHGTAAGVFTSDETLDGTNPSKGVELCTVVEFMRSLETLVEKTGDTYYADLLELNCFNALPATITKDYTAHQYVQQPNAIAANRIKRDFSTCAPTAPFTGWNPITAVARQICTRVSRNSRKIFATKPTKDFALWYILRAESRRFSRA